MAGKINYSNQVYKSIQRDKIRQDVVNATEGSRELRKEISRIFQKANRRIQNIESAGLYSPAVQALGDRGSGYSKFSMGGKSFTELKMEYGKAVAFLREPTSTATGTRQYHEHIRQAYELTQEEYDLMMDKFMGNILSVKDSDFVERYLMKYKDFTGELETAASDVSAQIESDAYVLEAKLQSDIENTVDRVLDPALDELMAELEAASNLGTNAGVANIVRKLK